MYAKILMESRWHFCSKTSQYLVYIYILEMFSDIYGHLAATIYATQP